MGSIHVNTDTMRQLAQAYLTWNNTLQTQMLPQLQSLSSQLEGDWVGVSRTGYDNQLQSWQQSLSALGGLSPTAQIAAPSPPSEQDGKGNLADCSL